MGLFNRTRNESGDTKERLDPFQKFTAKGLAKAQKRGILAGEPLLVVQGFEDSRETFLVLYPDRLELHTGAKAGSLTSKGAGLTDIPLGNITSVSMHSAGMAYAQLKITGSGIDAEHRIPGGDFGSEIRRRILEAKANAA